MTHDDDVPLEAPTEIETELDLDDFDLSRSERTVSIPAAVTGGLCGMIIVAALGFAGGWMLRAPADVAEVHVPDELAQACVEDLEATEDELSVAQNEVNALEREVATKEGRVNELEASIARGAVVGKALRAELAELKVELAQTQEKLAIAEAEKEQLLVDLTETKVELAKTQDALVETRVERDDAREDALFNRWQGFLVNSQAEICDKGNRKKLGNCREVVMATVGTDSYRDRFAHCIRSGQAQPMVGELVKDASVPEFADMLDDDVKQVKGWFVDFCDPSLPERSDAPLAEGQLPSTQSASG